MVLDKRTEQVLLGNMSHHFSCGMRPAKLCLKGQKPCVSVEIFLNYYFLNNSCSDSRMTNTDQSVERLYSSPSPS